MKSRKMEASDVAEAEFLWKAIQLIPSNKESYVLKCQLVSKCKMLHDKGLVRLPMKLLQKSSVCQYCCNILKDKNCSYKLLPEKVPPKSVKKIISRYKRNPDGLRKFEIGLAKKYCQRKNTLVIKCGVCHKLTKLPLTKPQLPNLEVQESQQTPTSSVKKKNKKKRDLTAGLKIPANLLSPSICAKMKRSLDNTEEIRSSKSGFSESEKKGNVSDVEKLNSLRKGATPVSSEHMKKSSNGNETPLSRGKKIYKVKVEKKEESFKKDTKLSKLVLNNKLSKMLNNPKKSTESPLSKFLSSL
ncbi:hypothetical protein J437_LFUL009913 [Ladona fulva]|uniref:Uncharacterized protein n=1 Tax=Ladona fulva TaxID=123851 RepID=A0A8K0K119_LADFU|nr:hypothetical protein J437_LFUL009913 [Ladona fulva]